MDPHQTSRRIYIALCFKTSLFMLPCDDHKSSSNFLSLVDDVFNSSQTVRPPSSLSPVTPFASHITLTRSSLLHSL